MGLDQKINKLIKLISDSVPPDRSLLVPISGGSDSAFCFWLCNKALPNRVLGIYVGDNLRSEAWFKSVGDIKIIKYPESDIDPELMRWANFLSLSLKEGCILVGTRNKTEDVLGTYSMASRVAWFFPIVGLWKSEILELCKYAGVPDEIVQSSSQADPMCGRPQELAEIPVELIDTFLKNKEGEGSIEDAKKLTAQEIEYLEQVYKLNTFKKKLPIRIL